MFVSRIPVNRPRAATVLLGVAYLLVAALSVSLARFDGGVAFIWPATALLVADLRHRPGPDAWLRVAACAGASVIATALFGLGWRAALPMAVVNIAEALGCVVLIRSVAPLGCRLESPRELGCFIAAAGLLVPGLSGLAGAGVAHIFAAVPYWSNWRGWWAGHGLGLLILLPVAKLAFGGELAGWARGSSSRQRIEVALILLYRAKNSGRNRLAIAA